MHPSNWKLTSHHPAAEEPTSRQEAESNRGASAYMGMSVDDIASILVNFIVGGLGEWYRINLFLNS